MSSKQNIGEEIIEGLEDALEHARGQRALRTTEVRPAALREIRESSGLTQQDFACLIKVNVRTLQNWEQGHRRPTGPAAVLLNLIRENPDGILKEIQRL